MARFRANAQLRRLLHDVEEPTYNNVFAVGLHEVQELGTLTDIDAARWLYSLTAGLDRVSLFDVQQELEHSRLRLMGAPSASSQAPGGERPSQVGELLSQRDRLRLELAQLAGLSQRHGQLAGDRAACEKEIAEVAHEMTAQEAEHGTLRVAVAAYDAWQRRSALDAQLAAIGQWKTWPADAVPRMKRILSAIRQARRRRQRIAARRQQLGGELRQISLNEALCRQAARIEALAEHESWITAAEQQLQAAEATAKSLADQQASRFAHLQQTAPQLSAMAQPLDEHAWETLRRPAAGVAKSHRRYAAVERESQVHKDTADVCRRQLEVALEGSGQRDLTAAMEARGAESLATAPAHPARRAARSTRENAGRLGTSHRRAGAAADFAAADRDRGRHCVRVGSGAAVERIVFARVADRLLGLAVGVDGLVGKRSGRRYQVHFGALGGAAARCLPQATRHGARASETSGCGPRCAGSIAAKNAWIAGGSDCKPPSRNWQSWMHSCRWKHSARRPNKRRREVRLQGAVLRDNYQQARSRWRAALAAARLPEGLSPAQAKQMLLVGGEYAALARRLAEAQADVDRHRRELAALAGRIEQTFAASGLEAPVGSLADQVRFLRRELAEHESRRRRRDALRMRRQKLTRRQTAVEQKWRRWRRRRERLMADCHVADLAEFRRRAADFARVESLTAQRDAAAVEITSRLAGQPARPPSAQSSPKNRGSKWRINWPPRPLNWKILAAGSSGCSSSAANSTSKSAWSAAIAAWRSSDSNWRKLNSDWQTPLHAGKC